MSIATAPTSLVTIEAHAKKYAAARAVVAERVSALDAEIRDANRRKIPGIKSALADAKDAQANLVAAIQSAPELFVKPRTFSLHGIKVGYGKGRGALSWEDTDMVVARIDRFFPHQVDVLIEEKRTPVKDALKQLDAKDLAKLGITYEGVGDCVIVKASDSAVDKLVKKILEEGAVEEAEAN